jgi:hypothetical protein
MKLSLANSPHNLVTDETAPLTIRETPLWLAAGFWISIVIAVAMILPRLIEPKQFFGLAFWIGFSISTTAAGLWLNSRKRQSQTERMAACSGVQW